MRTFTQKVLFLLIFGGAFFLFMFQRSVEYQGDDDYLFFCDAAIHTNIQIVPDGFTREDLVRWGKRTVKPFINAPHNLMPQVLYSLCWRVMDWLEVPFSFDTLHIPPAALTAFSCSFLFWLLLRFGFSTGLAAIGAVLYALSPIHAAACRSITLVWASTALFSQMLALWALEAYARKGRGAVWVGLAFTNIVFADLLFFLALPALVVAYALRDSSFKEALLQLRMLPRRLWENTRPLRVRAIVLPVSAAILWWVVITLYAFAADRLGLWRPVTPLYRLTYHVKDVGPLIVASPQLLHDYFSLLMGEAFLYVFVLAIVLHAVLVRRPERALLWSYAVIASVGYGLLFYVLTGHTWQKKNLYHIYTLLPFLLLLLMMCRNLMRERPSLRRAVFPLLGVLIVSAGVGTLSYVWRLPLAVSKTAYADFIHGQVFPNLGTKGVGCILRLMLDDRLTKRPVGRVVIRTDMPPGLTVPCSVVTFAGLMSDGIYFERKYGIRPEVILETLSGFRAGDLQLYVECDLREGDAPTTAAVYNIARDGKVIARLVVQHPLGEELVPAPGTYELEELENRFDATYRRLADYYPAPYFKPKPYAPTAKP